ncbi:MAG: aldehyde dehydrogenase family protein [Alphaproteobacteria bacterium]|nr:MAG: aldehyde dehydrogenase family protein [Alphaproteobacteria bacterium]
MAPSGLYEKYRPRISEVAPAIINGKREAALSDERVSVINPADGTQLLEIVEADEAQVNHAVGRARDAFLRGSWSRAPLLERQAVLSRAANLVRENAEELAVLDTMTTGLTFAGATHGQAQAAAGWFDYFAGFLLNMGDDLYRQIPHVQTTVTRNPVGVAALFTPWNIPLMGAALKLGAALSMGNSAVIKPSEQSPLGTIRLVELLHEAGLPEGVLQLVNGRGAVTGAALAGHADVDLISFTGGEGAGRIISRMAAERFAKITMELGGKSANIIFDDADYDRALDGAIMAIYANNGAACLAGSRILVQNSIADKFIADFADRAKAIAIGDPFDPATELGPQSSKAHMDRVLSFKDKVRDEGGEIILDGARVPTLGEGFYISPTVSVAISNRNAVCQEEIFGPFATFLTFETEEEAVQIANDTRFGLAGYVWSDNLQRAMRVADALRTGYVLVNSPMVRERNAPFGGYGHSGIDREGGRWSLDFYSEAKTTVIPFRDFAVPTMGKSKE